MGTTIRIRAGSVSIDAELNDTTTAQLVADALPFEAKVNTWGDEVYFEIPVKAKLDETARELVQKGDIGYWATGRAMCLFFGPTPISSEGEIRPASAVNIIGRILDNPEALRDVRDNVTVRITRSK